MINLFTRPLRVYVTLGALALWGILSGFQLPISLFPTSSQTTIAADVNYGPYSAKQFYETYGSRVESQLQRIKVESSSVKELKAEYRNSSVAYRITFEWGAGPEKAMSEVRILMNTHFASADEDIRRSVRVRSWRENAGLFAVSFYSPMRSLDELYETLNPMIIPLSSQIEDADGVDLYNPNEKEITVTLSPERMAQYEITSYQIETAIQNSIASYNGGTLKIGEKNYLVDIPKNVGNVERLAQIRVSPRGKSPIFLKDVAKITTGLSKGSQEIYKTSGVESLIMFASPKEGGNIKKMADQIMAQMMILEKQWPSDVQYKVLVNPSEFINKSVQSVIKEVFLAAFLAVVILFFSLEAFAMLSRPQLKSH